MERFISFLFFLSWGKLSICFWFLDLKPESSSIWMILSIHDFFFYFFSVFQDLPISQDHYLKNVANHRSFARQMELRDYFRSPKRGELFHDIGSTKFFDIHKITNSRVFFFWYIFINCKYYKKTNSTYWGCHRKCLQLYFYFLFSYYHES